MSEHALLKNSPENSAADLISKGETSVEATGLCKVYWDGNRRLDILKNVFFSVKRGEGVAILGPSGSGKTTLLNLLSGLDTPTEGRVKLGGVEISRLNENAKARLRNESIGFVFQFYHLLSEFSALENVMLPGLMQKGRDEKKIRQRAGGLLAEVGLADRAEHFPSELSGGEQQRVAIARALMNDPEILFCDEPTGNLDPSMGVEIAELLHGFIRRGKKTLVVATHDERIAKMTDRVWNILEKN